MNLLRHLSYGFVASVLLVLPALSARAEVVEAVHWGFNDTTSDSSSNANDGTISGSASYVSGKWGNAISLSAGASVDNLSVAALPLGPSDPWSINVWLKLDAEPASLSYMCGFGTGIDVGGTEDLGNQRALINFGSGFYFWGNAADVESGAAYGDNGNWHMFTVTSDGTNLSMYRDAILVKGPEALPAWQAAAAQIRVGGVSTWNAAWAGSVDEFTIWSGALTPEQIVGLNTLNAVPEPSSLMLAVSGVCGLLAYAWRRRR